MSLNLSALDLAERIVRSALESDDSDGLYHDWDLVFQAYDLIVETARGKERYATLPSDVTELLCSAAEALRAALYEPSTTEGHKDAEQTLRELQRWKGEE